VTLNWVDPHERGAVSCESRYSDLLSQKPLRVVFEDKGVFKPEGSMSYRSQNATKFVPRAALLLAAGLSAPVYAQHFDFVSNGVALSPGITPSMFLNNQNVAPVGGIDGTRVLSGNKVIVEVYHGARRLI
jgi:hypothetical protein